MKKIAALILVLCMTFALVACSSQSGGATTDNQSTNESTESQQTTQPDEQDAATEGDDTNTPDADASSSEEDNTPAEGASGEDNNTPAQETDSKILVAYFSCTGNTEGIASHIANALGAGLYEIVPEEPYTSADLNYNDSSTRATVEQHDDTARPAISSSVENMDDYDIIFIGYPIWWGQAPKIIYTFVESYDLSGKTIVPFCSSASSGVGSSATNLHSSAPDANWLDGTRFSASASQSSIEKWISGLSIEVAGQ